MSSGVADSHDHDRSSLSGSGAARLDRSLKVIIVIFIFGWLAALVLLLSAELLPYLPQTPLIAAVARSSFGNLWHLAASALAVGSLAVALAWRWQVMRSSKHTTSAGCPNCQARRFVRVRRSQFERSASALLALPAERHRCRTCGWKALLISEHDGSPDISHTPSEMANLGTEAPWLEESTGTDGFWTSQVSDRNVRTARASSVPAPGADLHDQSRELARVSTSGATHGQSRVSAAPTGPVRPRWTRERTGADANGFTSRTAPARSSSVPLGHEPAAAAPRASTKPAASSAKGPSGNAAARTPNNGSTSLTTQPQAPPSSASTGKRALPTPPASRGTPSRTLTATWPQTAPGIQERPDPGVAQAVVTAPVGLKLRSAPRGNAEVLYRLPPDTIVRLVNPETSDEPSAWQQVYVGGLTGWVASAYLRRLPRR